MRAQPCELERKLKTNKQTFHGNKLLSAVYCTQGKLAPMAQHLEPTFVSNNKIVFVLVVVVVVIIYSLKILSNKTKLLHINLSKFI